MSLLCLCSKVVASYFFMTFTTFLFSWNQEKILRFLYLHGVLFRHFFMTWTFEPKIAQNCPKTSSIIMHKILLCFYFCDRVLREGLSCQHFFVLDIIKFLVLGEPILWAGGVQVRMCGGRRLWFYRVLWDWPQLSGRLSRRHRMSRSSYHTFMYFLLKI